MSDHDANAMNNEQEGYMVTIGTEKFGLRITKGRLDRHGNWHPKQPCVFFLVNGKRKP